MPEQLSDCPTNDRLLPYSYFYHNACIYARRFDVPQLLEMIVHKIESARKMLHDLQLKIEFHPSLRSGCLEADILLEEAAAYAQVAIKKSEGSVKSGEEGGKRQTC